MGAVTFSIDPQLVAAIKRALPLSLFVETGTFHGDSLAIVATQFDECISIEASEALWRESSARFASTPSVRVLHSDSSLALAELRARLSKAPTLFWLDAHWCVAANTAGETSQCPLLAEIDAIGQLHEQSVVLIDDARLFLAPPPEPHLVAQWPVFADVVSGLLKLSAVHELMVINDVIAFYPRLARASLEAYARSCGIDWLHARQALEENKKMRLDMEEKEALIHRLDGALKQQDNSVARRRGQFPRHEEAVKDLEEKESVIQDLKRRVEAKDTAEKILNESIREKDVLIRDLSRVRDIAAAKLEVLERSAFDKDRYIAAMERALDTLRAQQHHIEQALIEKEGIARDLLAEMHSIRAAHEDELRLRHEETKQRLGALDAPHSTASDQLELMDELVKKEAVIKELSAALAAYRAAYLRREDLSAREKLFVKKVSQWRSGIATKIKRWAQPKLGTLNQHAPIDLVLPAWYGKEECPTRPPRISIVTPSYKQAAFIERTLQSVLDQGYPNLEYFVQDGCSKDGTEEILDRYAHRLSGWQSKPDDGQSNAINLGMDRTTGEIMAWINSDDILFPGSLAYIARYFDAHPEIDVVYGHRLLIDENDRQIGRWIMPAHDDNILSWADFVPQETLFWRREIWNKAGGRVDESFRFAMDWDLLVRFRSAGAKFARLPRLLGGFRIHTQQKTSAAISDIGFKEMARIRERALGKNPTHVEINRAIAPYLIRHLVSDFVWRLRRG